MLPEQRLVVTACRAAFRQHAVAELHGLVGGVNPSHAITLADDLGVLGLVSHQMRAIPGADPVWEGAWRANLARNVMLGHALATWTQRLQAAGVEVVMLKGPALARSAFGSIGLRDSTDLDLIVPHEQVYAALDVCRAHGALPLNNVLPAHDRLGAICLEVPDCNNTYSLDVHAGWIPRWGHLPERRLPPDMLETVTIGGRPVVTLGPDLTMIHSACHSAQHVHSLKTLVDVCATRRRVCSLGLERGVDRLAGSLGVSRVVTRATHIADRLLMEGSGGSFPPGRRTARELATPNVHDNAWKWLERRSMYPARQIVADAIRLAFPPAAELTSSREWGPPERPGLRRLLRPLRLLARVANTLRTNLREGEVGWRDREALRFRRPEPSSRRARGESGPAMRPANGQNAMPNLRPGPGDRSIQDVEI